MNSRSIRRAVQQLAAQQDGVVSRHQASELGAGHDVVRRQIEAGHWQAVGRQTIACHAVDLAPLARVRTSVWEASNDAVLDGSSSLILAGLKGWVDATHVIVPWPQPGRSWGGTRVHRTRLYDPADFIETNGIVHTRPDVATVRAGMYAPTNRAAATVIAMAAHQGLADPAAILVQALRVNRHKRRRLILDVAHDIVDGARALSELDFARLCRLWHLPEPSRQVLRRGPRGRYYLDVYWDEYGVVVEVEGIHHDAPENSIDDALRQNDLTLERDSVLRVPVLGIRVCPEQFMKQVAVALTEAGWRRTA